MKSFRPLFLIFVFSAVSSISLGQNMKDQNGKKHGKWIYKGKDKPGLGYAANTKVEEGVYEHGRKTGIWIKYHKDGQTVKLKGNYLNNRPNGEYARYHSNGTLMEQGNFGGNKQVGSLNIFYKSGKVAFKGNFDANGKETGKIIHYYENGKVQAEFELKGGKPTGTYSQYNKDGTLKFSYKLNNGRFVQVVQNSTNAKPVKYSKPVSDDVPPKVTNPITKGVTFFPDGYNKVYNTSDEIWLDGNFRKGQLYEGKVYIYNSSGILKKINVYKEGKFHSISQN